MTFWSDYDTSSSGSQSADYSGYGAPEYVTNPAVASSESSSGSGSGWGGWNTVLQDAFKFGVGRWIDSETRQNSLYNTSPNMYGAGTVPIMTTGATSVSNKSLLVGGALLLAVLAFVAFQK